jgi:hypothetical protein
MSSTSPVSELNRLINSIQHLNNQISSSYPTYSFDEDKELLLKIEATLTKTLLGESNDLSSPLPNDFDEKKKSISSVAAHTFAKKESVVQGPYINCKTYVGDLVDGKRHGYGVLTCPVSGIYSGDWLDDKLNGIATHRFPNGDSYHGQWKDGLKEGFGTFTWKSGKTYTGHWHLNKRHGTGLRISSQGKTKFGIWLQGKLQHKTSMEDCLYD